MCPGRSLALVLPSNSDSVFPNLHNAEYSSYFGAVWQDPIIVRFGKDHRCGVNVQHSSRKNIHVSSQSLVMVAEAFDLLVERLQCADFEIR